MLKHHPAYLKGTNLCSKVTHVVHRPLGWPIVPCFEYACSVQEALAAQGASYAPGAGPLAGKAALRGNGADVEIDLSGLAERLWAVELAALHRAAADAAAEERRRCEERPYTLNPLLFFA